LFHDASCNRHRVHEILQRGNGTGITARTIHDRRVELDMAGAIGR